MAKTRWGETTALLVTFLLIIGVLYWVYTVAAPLSYSNPLVDFLASWLNFDLVPPPALKIGVALVIGICLGLVAYVGNLLAEKATVVWRS